MRHEAGDEAPFLAEICAAPDDDLPRLVFADWLEERNDPRGEFIRVQCQLARSGDSANDSLAQREAALLAAHAREWTAGLARFSTFAWRFRRGFVEAAAAWAATFVRQGGELLSFTPVRMLWLTQVRHELISLGQCPSLEYPTALALAGARLEPDDFRLLLHSPYLARLTGLDLEQNRLARARGASAIELLDQRLPALSRLGLRGCWVDERQLTELAHAPLAARLTHLDLSYNPFDFAGLQALLESPAGARLERLDLEGCRLNDLHAQWLMKCRGLGRLRMLRLAHNHMGLSAKDELRERFGPGVQFTDEESNSALARGTVWP